LKLHSAIFSPLVHFLYPHNCVGCGSDVLQSTNLLCLECINDLPHTNFALHPDNPAEKIFRGRLKIQAAMSEIYFSKNSVIQNCIHEFKYRGNKKMGLLLGKMMGKSLLNASRFSGIDALVPLPLFIKKELRRGFNQATILCEGIAEVTHIPLITKNVVRIAATETQTKKGRIQRWENVEKSFSIADPSALKEKHILLVDDVITTGATLEACGAEILKIQGVHLSIATLAFATR
jgi:ComF family protein